MKDNLNKIFNDRTVKPATDRDRQLLAAAETGDAAKVAALIKKGANVFVDSHRPLFLAAKNHHRAVIKLLTAAGSHGIPLYGLPELRMVVSEGGKSATYADPAIERTKFNSLKL